MKNISATLIIILLISGINKSYSQDSCKALKQELSGKYQGACKKGLANGKGIAEGIDKYEGRFKDGFPHGQGIYRWANGNTYNGSWKNGMRQGTGTFKYKINGADSVLYGIWENDIFIKKAIAEPYKIYIARDFDRYSISKIRDGNKVSVRLQQMGMPNTDVSDFSFYADNGSYQAIGNTYVYFHVLFPVHIKISYNTKNKLKTSDISPVLEVIINEPGEWEIELTN